MRVGRVGAVALMVLGLAAVARAQSPAEIKGAYAFKQGGWTYVHLEGAPHELGFQHGYLLKDEIDDNLSVYRLEAVNDYHRDWGFFRDAAKNVLWPKIEPEYRAELQGIADGRKARLLTCGTWWR